MDALFLILLLKGYRKDRDVTISPRPNDFGRANHLKGTKRYVRKTFMLPMLAS